MPNCWCGRELVVKPEGVDRVSTRWYECPVHGIYCAEEDREMRDSIPTWLAKDKAEEEEAVE